MTIGIIESESGSKMLFGRHCLCLSRLQVLAIKMGQPCFSVFPWDWYLKDFSDYNRHLFKGNVPVAKMQRPLGHMHSKALQS